MGAHVVKTGTYLLVYAALLVLTAATYGASKIPLGAWGPVVAMAIAAAKTALVALYFMHLRWSGARQRIIGLAGLFWLAIMLGLTVSDYFTRDWFPDPEPWS